MGETVRCDASRQTGERRPVWFEGDDGSVRAGRFGGRKGEKPEIGADIDHQCSGADRMPKASQGDCFNPPLRDGLEAVSMLEPRCVLQAGNLH